MTNVITALIQNAIDSMTVNDENMGIASYRFTHELWIFEAQIPGRFVFWAGDTLVFACDTMAECKAGLKDAIGDDIMACRLAA